jgi:hypothetical protein
LHRTAGRHGHGVLSEIREPEILTKQPAVGVRIRTHPTRALWRERAKLGLQRPARLEQLFWLVAAHPVFEQFQVGRIVAHVGERDLMRPPRRLDLVSLDLLGPRPSLRRTEHDHRPPRTDRTTGGSGVLLGRANVGHGLFERGGHRLVHQGRIAPLYEIRRVPIADKQRFELFVADAREHRRIRDLVAVEDSGWAARRHREPG